MIKIKPYFSKQFFIESLLIFYLMTTCGCSGSIEYEPGNSKEVKTAIKNLSKTVSSYNDTLIINTESAVFFNPDSLQLEKIKAVNEKNIGASMEHDCFFQMRNARMVLKKYWPRVNIIESSKARFLLFIKVDKTTHCIDLNSINDMCGIILFNRIKDPELVDMMNIDTALEFYFTSK